MIHNSFSSREQRLSNYLPNSRGEWDSVVLTGALQRGMQFASFNFLQYYQILGILDSLLSSMNCHPQNNWIIR